jgi:hypothetical protein
VRAAAWSPPFSRKDSTEDIARLMPGARFASRSRTLFKPCFPAAFAGLQAISFFTTSP